MVLVIRFIVALFFCFGAVDMFMNNRIGVGERFANGIKAMGGLALGMLGIYSLSPIIGEALMLAFGPLSKLLGIDISIFPAMFIAVDMGAHRISEQIAQNEEIGKFAGIIIGSTFGTALSFSFPVAVAVIRQDDLKFFLKSFVIGILTIPPGCFIAGLVQGIDVVELLKSISPMIVLSITLLVIFFINEKIIMKVLSIFYKLILLVGLVGIVAQGVYSIIGVELIVDLIPLEEAALIVVQIAFFLGGIYPIIGILQRVLRKLLYKLELKTGINNISLICVMGNFVSNIMVFDLYKDFNEKGKMLCGVLSIGVAFVIGGQLAYISAVENSMLVPFLTSKLVSGGLCLVIFYFYQKNY